jgi:hypothetical protein
MAKTAIGDLFWVYATDALQTMARAGMNDTDIARVIVSIRAAAIHEEKGRSYTLALDHPSPLDITTQDATDDMLALWGTTINKARNDRK